MSRLLRTVLVAVVIMSATPGQANAAPDEDFVVGTGAIAIPNPLNPLSTVLVDISLDAHSDASGGTPAGTVVVTLPVAGLVLFSGSVTCLAVTGNRAVIVIEDAFGPATFEVFDNTAIGTPDTIGLIAGVADCSPFDSPHADPLVSGDFVVHDALPLTSRNQCKLGGWRDFTDDEGHPFENQGECIAFVQHAT